MSQMTVPGQDKIKWRSQNVSHGVLALEVNIDVLVDVQSCRGTFHVLFYPLLSEKHSILLETLHLLYF